MTKPISRLFCFDFDNTIVDGHFHNALFSMGVHPTKATPEQINELLEKHAIFNEALLLKTFKTILSNGHHIAITTWSLYPEVIRPTLRKLGLSEAEIAKIHIESGFPHVMNDGKKGHIARAKQHFEITDNKNVFLIDDDENNILLAREEGQTGFHAVSPKTNTDYLQNILTLLDKPAPRRSVRIASLNTIEGQRLFEVRRDLQAKGKRRQGIRKDGEEPLGRFLAKNPQMATVATPAAKPVAVATTVPSDIKANEAEQTSEDNKKPLAAKVYAAAQDADYKARKKIMLFAALIALSVAAILSYCAMSFFVIVPLSALAFSLVAVIGDVQMNLYSRALSEKAKDQNKWMAENENAYTLGIQSGKAWIPYLTSYVQPKAYTSAYRIGFTTTLITDKVLGKKIDEIVAKYTPKP